MGMDNSVEKENRFSHGVANTPSRTSTKLITVYHCSHNACC